MANDAIVSWQKSPSSGVTSYLVQWTQNGTALSPVSVPQTTASDSSGYSLDLVSSQPGIVVNGGDVIGVTVTAVNATSGLSSTPAASVPPTVTEPTTPVAPSPPTNVTLALA